MTAQAGTLTRQGLRFLLFGGLNTGLTYALFVGLVLVLHPQLAYATAFATGISLAYLGNSIWVFAARPRVRSALAYPLLYGSQYLINAGLLQLLGVGLGWPPWFALGAALCVSVPVSFLMNRWLFSVAPGTLNVQSGQRT